MYKVVYGMQKYGNYETFEEAFAKLYRILKKDIEAGNMSWQVLETAVWIETPKRPIPMYFYEARDHACDIGLLIDGKLNKEMLEKSQLFYLFYS